jgi:dihydrofolate synthase/folylpolyglutamate synthase
LAFLYFARQQVDIGVIEVGLGGRLDATNVITPEISVITSLSLDHTRLLGNTVADIAREKGGIIKPGVPTVSAPQKPEALAVLKTIATKRDAPLTVVGWDWAWEALQHDLERQTIAVRRMHTPSDYDGTYTLSLLGDFQQENAAVTIATAAVLHANGHAWANPTTVHAGLAQTQWPGRMEVLQREPPVVLDCAHNPYSAETLAQSLKTWFPDTRWILIFGASNDKDIPSVLKALLPLCERVLMTKSYHPRSTAPETLAAYCAALGKTADVVVEPPQALAAALEYLKPGLGIITTGSIFLVADVRTAWAKERGLNLPLGDWDDEPW